MSDLATAFAKFRRGQFAEARADALTDPGEFWAVYLAAVSAAFEPDLKEFEKHLGVLEAFNTKNVYLHYLKAYYALLQRDIEKALWHYLEIADDPEGWLAKSLIKKFRKIKTLENVEFRVADFIVLPAELPPRPLTPNPSPRGRGENKLPSPFGRRAGDEGKRGWQFAKKDRWRFPSLPYRRLFIVASAAFAAISIFVVIRENRSRNAAQVKIPNLQIADSAAVMPVADKEKILYTYKTRDRIIADFDRAKQLLQERKVNQSRYILNRLLYSNADFQTREKSRIFSGFISDPDFTDFNDNLSLKELFENVKLRAASLIVITGEIRDIAEENGGTQYQFIAREEGKEFRVHAFRPVAVKEEKLQTNTQAKTMQVYGRFKGLVGEQKAIYLEALRVWR